MSINSSIVPYNIQDYLYIDNNYLIRDRYCIYYNPETRCNLSVLSNKYITPIPAPYLEIETKSTRWDLPTTSVNLHITSVIAEVFYNINWQSGEIFPDRQPIFPYIIHQEFERIFPVDQKLPNPVGRKSTSPPLLTLAPPVLVNSEKSSRSLRNEPKPGVETSQSAIFPHLIIPQNRNIGRE
jgi:hypothetical protein